MAEKTMNHSGKKNKMQKALKGKKTMNWVKKALKPLEKNSFAVLLYGSAAKNESHEKSDIDVCVIAGEKKKLLFKETNILMSKHSELDIKLFEELPLYIKKDVIQEGILLYCKNKQELEELFRLYRKLWNEQAAVRLNYAKAIA
jgi:hypothetical protein